MPILLDWPYNTRFYDSFILECASDEDKAAQDRCIEARKKWKSEDMHQMMDEGQAPIQWVTFEHPLRQEIVPKRLKMTKGLELPDYVISSPAGKLVSEPLKELIAQQEPPGNGFQFFPITIEKRGGGQFNIPYYVWDVYRKIDAIDAESPRIKSAGGPVDGNHLWTFTRSKNPMGKEDLFLSKKVIEGLAAWTDYRYNRGGYFVSDKLYDSMTAENMTGFGVNSEWSVR